MVWLEIYQGKQGQFQADWWPPIRRHNCETLKEARETADKHLAGHKDLTCIIMDETGARKPL